MPKEHSEAEWPAWSPGHRLVLRCLCRRPRLTAAFVFLASMKPYVDNAVLSNAIMVLKYLDKDIRQTHTDIKSQICHRLIWSCSILHIKQWEIVFWWNGAFRFSELIRIRSNALVSHILYVPRAVLSPPPRETITGLSPSISRDCLLHGGFMLSVLAHPLFSSFFISLFSSSCFGMDASNQRTVV